MRSKAFLILLTSILFLLLAPLSVLGKEANNLKHYQIDNEVNSFTINELTEVRIDNDEILSTLKVIINGKEVFNKGIDYGYVKSFYHFEKDQKEYFVVEEKSHGTASALSIAVLEIEDQQVTTTQISEEYVKGIMNLDENLQMEVIYPKYKETDSNANPSFIQQDTFEMKGNSFVKVDTKDITSTINQTEKSNQQYKFSIKENKTAIEKIKGTNPSYSEINKYLTQAALANGIPPEILKAIAWQESRWQQFYPNGDLVIGFDGIGIGIMQVSDYNRSDEEEIRRLSEDIRYNIEKGVQILLSKWNYGGKKDGNGRLLIPTINNNDKSVLENWYFAILAYNGLLHRNNPIVYPLSVGPSQAAYQELIYDHIRKKGKVNITPFPVERLKNDIYYLVQEPKRNTRMHFKTSNYKISGPFHKTNHVLKKNTVVRVTSNEALLKSNPNNSSGISLNKGDILIIKSDSLAFRNSNEEHFVYYKVQNVKDGKEYYVQAPFIEKLDVNNFTRYDLNGWDRYSTSVEISKKGWSNRSDTVVLARGDNPVDGLAGSVLASKHDSPLLLVNSNVLPESVSLELNRLKPSKIYILGSEVAISKNIENDLKQRFGKSAVVRIEGSGRYATAVNIAKEIGSFKEVFIVTDNEKSPDPLSIGSVAGQRQAPILFSSKNGLTSHSLSFLEKNKNVKVYLIGGENVVPDRTKEQLKQIGITNVERVSGSDRYRTSTAIAKKFATNNESIVFVSGVSFVDALPGAPLAAKVNAPIILVEQNRVPGTVNLWLKEQVKSLPTLYFLGGDTVISQNVRGTLIQTVINNLIK